MGRTPTASPPTAKNPTPEWVRDTTASTLTFLSDGGGAERRSPACWRPPPQPGGPRGHGPCRDTVVAVVAVRLRTRTSRHSDAFGRPSSFAVAAARFSCRPPPFPLQCFLGTKHVLDERRAIAAIYIPAHPLLISPQGKQCSGFGTPQPPLFLFVCLLSG